MTIWITGANGFIGRYLTRELAQRGLAVHGVGHGAIEEPEKHYLGMRNWLNGEIESANLNALAVRAGLPSIVFHLAGGSSVGVSIAQPYEDFSRTVTTAARLLEWLRTTAPECHLVVVSSAAVYGAAHVGRISESATTEPVSPYGQHKLIIEQLSRSYATTFGLQSTIVRLFSVYGANLRKQLLWDICMRLREGGGTLTLGGTGRELRDWTEVRDVARLLAHVGCNPPDQAVEIINGGSGIATSVADIARHVMHGWGLNIPVEFSGVARPGDPLCLVADPSRLNALSFEWEIAVRTGIADYVTWFKEQFL
ncbi:UDP-glucose 4-epimerase [Bradyrhizobium genosp. SA-3]|uniref:NAD-dependent epimerase/dehydratase family protein n=1 Tax=Bradyrhizobium genosp. SA-3 TaxID=508868 RepID=UPI001029C142|nr:NAD(P)-dependent oxidoreductase [Bradyrhizobium genosp. SA-3]RZN08674.1 UDP-glucose 4-epimerase [Bradyrhizobium genosp. SA-3]